MCLNSESSTSSSATTRPEAHRLSGLSTCLDLLIKWLLALGPTPQERLVVVRLAIHHFTQTGSSGDLSTSWASTDSGTLQTLISEAILTPAAKLATILRHLLSACCPSPFGTGPSDYPIVPSYCPVPRQKSKTYSSLLNLKDVGRLDAWTSAHRALLQLTPDDTCNLLLRPPPPPPLTNRRAITNHRISIRRIVRDHQRLQDAVPR